MADLKYTVDVDTNPGIASLNKLQNQVSKTTQVFGSLKNAIVGLAVGGAIAQLYEYADAIDDVAKANNLAIEAVMGFSSALSYNGGRAEAAGNGLATFTSNISEAVDGSGKLQDTFGRLGISLTDLATMSEQDLLKKTIDGLVKLDNKTLQASLSTQLFGRALKGVELEGFAQDFGKYTESNRKNAESIKQAAEAAENLQRTYGKLKIEVLNALGPLSDFANKVMESTEAIGALIKIGIQVATLLLAFTVLGKAITFVRAAIVVLIEAWGGLMAAGATAINFFKNFGLIVENLGLVGFAGSLRVIGTLFSQLGAWAVKSIPGLTTLAVALAYVWDWLDKGIDKMKEWIGISAEASQSTAAQAKADEEAAKAARELIAAYAKKAQEIRRTSENFANANAEVLNNINTENQLIGKSKEYADVIKAQEALYKRNTDEINKLRDAKEDLTAEEKRAGLGAVYDEQIAKIQKLTEAESQRLERALKNQNMLQNAEQLRLFGIQNQIDKSKELKTIQDDIAKLGLSEIEKKYYDIDAAAKASAKSAIDAEAARRGNPLSAEEQKKYYDEALKGTEALKKAQGDLYAQSRSFSTGWNTALNDFVENATNAANQAQQIFSKVTSSMEDAFVNFAKTGKFEFKSMINSIIEDLLRMQIKASIAKVMGLGGSTGATGGLFGGKIIPGILASGGPVSSNRPYIVGERGPELFMPGVNGQMFPNSTLSGGGQSVVYNIQAVDAPSFQALVARDPSFIHAVAMAGAKAYPR